MNVDLDKSHNTAKELEYLTGLAKKGWCAQRDRERKEKHDPREALVNYLSAAKKRVNWDNMDKEVVLAYADELERKTR